MGRHRLVIYINSGEKYCGNCIYLVKGVPMGRLQACLLFDRTQIVSENENSVEEPKAYEEERVLECLQADYIWRNRWSVSK